MGHMLIIGGTHGLGRELVKLASARGDIVSVIGRSKPPQEDCDIPNVKHYSADLFKLPEFKEILSGIMEKSGKLNYLAFCQRYRGKGDNWQGEFDITINATKIVIEALEDEFVVNNDKAIVMVSSVFGDYVGEGQDISYHVGKAALNQMMKFYAVNLGRKHIRVNAVSPITFLKEESKEFYINNKPLNDLYRKMIPLGRMATSEDTAKVMSFLCSSQASFINGQNIYVDGGLSHVWPETLGRKLTSI